MFEKFVVLLLIILSSCEARVPIVLTTWSFEKAAQTAWDTLQASKSALDALEAGCKTCQDLQCDFTVGFGGSPDENGETTLDALIFDGNTMNMGAVGNIRKVKNAIKVARRVLQNTEHSMLVGDLATQFAVKMGLQEENLETNYSLELWKTWKQQNCQPNFWTNVLPDPTKSCGPYIPIVPHPDPTLTNAISQDPRNRYQDPTLTNEISPDPREKHQFSSRNHDTISMIVIGEDGHMVAGTSTNGANHKIPGRVGDSPIPGAGAYADNKVGAAVGTGDGDIMMRFLPSFLAVEQMRQGLTPAQAAKAAILRIAEYYPSFMGAIIATDYNGTYGAACNGIDQFPFYVVTADTGKATANYVQCSDPKRVLTEKIELK